MPDSSSRMMRITLSAWTGTFESKPVNCRIQPEAPVPIAMPTFEIHDWQAANEPSRRWPVSSSSWSTTSGIIEP